MNHTNFSGMIFNLNACIMGQVEPYYLNTVSCSTVFFDYEMTVFPFQNSPKIWIHFTRRIGIQIFRIVLGEKKLFYSQITHNWGAFGDREKLPSYSQMIVVIIPLRISVITGKFEILLYSNVSKVLGQKNNKGKS